jgi:hypothetical protein
MKTNKLFLLIFLLPIFLFILTSCNLQQYGITPELQCSLLRNGARVGIDVGLKNVSFDLEYIETGYVVLDQTVKRLKGQEVSHQDLEEILTVLNAELKPNEKLLVQSGINTFLAVTPNLLPEFSQNSLTSSIITNLICLFEGVLSAFANNKKLFSKTVEETENIEDNELEFKEIKIEEIVEVKEPQDFTIKFEISDCFNCD